MARFLIGWELGSGAGHIVRTRGVARALLDRGHQVVAAVQQIAAAPDGCELWQAPVWPGLLGSLARPATVTPATMGDILAVLGLGQPGALSALLRAWDHVLALVRPDVVLAEFAPALTLASHGRVPIVTLGNGFSLPPPDLPRFPSLTRRPTVHDEAALLATVNGALVENGLAERESLPALFRADRELAATFTELDPYRPWRTSVLGSPPVRPVDLADGGDELFVYMNGPGARPNAFWRGLVQSGLKIRIHDPFLSDADRATLSGAGLIVEQRPVPFEQIAARSRLLLSHGGHGFVSSGLLAGLPQLIMPADIEKHMIAASVRELGLGHSLAAERIDAGRLAEALKAAFGDEGLRARVRAAAPGFRSRMAASPDGEAADVAEALLA